MKICQPNKHAGMQASGRGRRKRYSVYPVFYTPRYTTVVGRQLPRASSNGAFWTMWHSFLGRCKTFREIFFIVKFWCRNDLSNGGNVRHTVETMTIITNAAVSLKCRRVSSAFRMWSEVTSKKNSTMYSEFEPIYDRGIVASSRLVTSFLSFTAGLLQVWLGEKWIPCVKNQTGTVDYYLTGSLSG